MIVVIGILAAISIVAYNGISNSANDNAVKNDLANMAKKIHLESVDVDGYLPGGTPLNSTAFPNFRFSPSKGSYMTSVNNLFYCTGLDASNKPVFVIEARSKSGKTFRHSSSEGLRDLGVVVSNQTTTCAGLTSNSWSYGYYVVQDRWWSWTD